MNERRWDGGEIGGSGGMYIQEEANVLEGANTSQTVADELSSCVLHNKIWCVSHTV